MFTYTVDELIHLDDLCHTIYLRNMAPAEQTVAYWQRFNNDHYANGHPTIQQIIDEIECGFVGGEELV